MKFKKYILIFLVLCLLIIPTIVNAVTIETGVLSGTGYNSSYYNLTTGIPTDKGLTGFYVNDIQYTAGLKTLIRFDAGHRPTFNDTVSGRSMPFVGTWGSYIVCTGTIGYQRLWDNAYPTPNEIDGYQYIVFDTWDYANYTGDIYIHLDYNKTLFGIHHYPYVPSPNLPSGKIAFGFRQDSPLVETSFAGNYLLNRDFTFYNEYIATKPQGLGITGTVGKTYYGEIYNSQAFVINGTSPYETLASQAIATSSDLEFNVPATTIKVCVLDTLQQWHNSSKLFSTGQEPNFTPTPTPTGWTPTPTPTPAPYDTWTMEVYPTAINLHDSAQLYISSTNSSRMSDAKTILYYENNNQGAYSTWDLIGVYRYNSSTSNWDFRVNNSVQYDYSAHDPALLMVTPKSTGTYSYQATVTGANFVNFGTATGDLQVGAQGGISGSLTMLLWAGDALTTSHLSNYQLQITDYAGTTRFYDVAYDISINLQRGEEYTLAGVKEGYENGIITFTVPVSQSIQAGDFGAMAHVSLYPTGELPTAGNCTITVHVDDIETYYPIANVQISMSGISIPKFTGTSGESVFFTKPQNTQFTVKAVKDGFCSVSETKNTSTNSYMYVSMFMKYGACVGVTPTHTPIPNATITPTITPLGGYGNVTGGVGVCNASVTANISWMQKARNMVACGGITDLLSQNLLIAVLIILIIGALAASKAKAVGFAIGGVLGAIISMLLGLIPAWALFILIIISVAILSLKIFFSQSGG